MLAMPPAYATLTVPTREGNMRKTLTEAKQDHFLVWAANDIMTKQGLDADHAWTIVMNTYCN